MFRYIPTWGMYRVGQKIRTVLRVDNFATVNGRKVCDMLIVFEFCLERKKKIWMAVKLNILYLVSIYLQYI